MQEFDRFSKTQPERQESRKKGGGRKKGESIRQQTIEENSYYSRLMQRPELHSVLLTPATLSQETPFPRATHPPQL